MSSAHSECHEPASGRNDWWDDILFATERSQRNLRHYTMLRVIAYDIADPKRLRRVAKVCESFGARVQFSVFECWLEGDQFNTLLDALRREMSSDHDSIVAYTLDHQAAKRRRSLGAQVTITDRLPSCLVL